MAVESKRLAALAVFRSLYNSKKDIFTIICEFMKDCANKRAIQVVNTSQMANYLKEDFCFIIPEAIIATALNRIATREKGEYLLTVSNDSHSGVSSSYNRIYDSNEEIIALLIAYIEQQESRALSVIEKQQLNKSFCAFLIEDNTNVEYSEYISAFIITHQNDQEFTGKLNLIKEGVVLYSGLKYNENVNEVGSWTTPLTIYVEPEILFHLAGYNGELYKKLFDDFYKLVREINTAALRTRKTPLITIKFFPEVKEEIDRFFKTAEKIKDGGEMYDASKTAMVSILSGCESSADVVQKKAEFEALLKRLSITQEEEFNFYNIEENNQYNIESDELLTALKEKMLEDEIHPHLKYLFYINVLRRGEEIKQFEKARYILLTGNWKTMSMAFHPLVKFNGNVPLATYLDFITSKLWFKLNKGFGNNDYPISFDVVSKAQMVLSAHINSSVSDELKKIKSQVEQGIMSQEGALEALSELKSRVHNPEDIENSNVEHIVQSIKDGDIEKYLREREIEREHARMESETNKRLKNEIEELEKRSEQKEKDYQDVLSAKDAEYQANLLEKDRVYNLALRESELRELREYIDPEIEQIENKKLDVNRKIDRRIVIYKCIPVLPLLLYLAIMCVCTYYFTWDCMEPYTYFGSILCAMMSYLTCVFVGKSWNPKIFFDVKCRQYLTNRLYKKHKIDTDKLVALHAKKKKILQIK